MAYSDYGAKDDSFLLIAMLGEVVATVEFAEQMKELLKL